VTVPRLRAKPVKQAAEFGLNGVISIRRFAGDWTIRKAGQGDLESVGCEVNVLHYLLTASLFALAGGHLWWIHHRVVGRVLAGREDSDQWRAALLGASWIMTLTILLNAQGFMKMNLMDWQIRGGESGPWLTLLSSHVSVLVGTWALLWLVVRSLREPAVVDEPTAMLGACRMMVVTAEKLLPRFWWAALGLGVLFGYAAGRGLVLVLAADLTLFWLIGRINMVILRRKLQGRRAGE